MNTSEELLLDALRCAIHGGAVSWGAEVDEKRRWALFRMATIHGVLPLLAQALWSDELPIDEIRRNTLFERAYELTCSQAARTASFLLLLEELAREGLRPLVLKGLVCRDLYPEPEQRASTDEDLLIAPGDFLRYHQALLSCGLELQKDYEAPEKEDEVTYVDTARGLCVELHLKPFPTDSDVFSPCNEYFSGALDRRVSLESNGFLVDTLHPTDHMLYLLLHAYKHVLYGGVGIRQICDLCLFSRRYSAEIDWNWIRGTCDRLGIQMLSAAFFRVGERHLDLPCPAAFADLDTDEQLLLCDCLSGGLYGAEDPDRHHSSRITLDAAEAGKQHRQPRGLLSSAFPSKSYMRGMYPYLKARPWLLPVAWGQRICRYLFREKASPSRSLQIGRERIELLKQYRVIS